MGVCVQQAPRASVAYNMTKSRECNCVLGENQRLYTTFACGFHLSCPRWWVFRPLCFCPECAATEARSCTEQRRISRARSKSGTCSTPRKSPRYVRQGRPKQAGSGKQLVLVSRRWHKRHNRAAGERGRGKPTMVGWPRDYRRSNDTDTLAVMTHIVHESTPDPAPLSQGAHRRVSK